MFETASHNMSVSNRDSKDVFLKHLFLHACKKILN